MLHGMEDFRFQATDKRVIRSTRLVHVDEGRGCIYEENPAARMVSDTSATTETSVIFSEGPKSSWRRRCPYVFMSELFTACST